MYTEAPTGLSREQLDENAHAVIDTYMDYCAKRWQTREGTYQLKRRSLLPDVRDPPEQGDEEVDMTDI